MNKFSMITIGAAALAVSGAAMANNKEVKITEDLMSVVVKHNGQDFEVKRNQNTRSKITSAFSKTSRPCPHFCVQPMNMGNGTHTIGEIKLLEMIKAAGTDSSIKVIDSRTPDWANRGTIPGAKNVPWNKINLAKTTDDVLSKTLQEEFGGKLVGGDVRSASSWDFSNAPTVVMFCNGMWCGQSPNNIKALHALGFPGDKIHWYRGGMQNWLLLGFPTVKP